VGLVALACTGRLPAGPVSAPPADEPVPARAKPPG
jgi:hypothetical protein